jgi:hypothetical protein
MNMARVLAALSGATVFAFTVTASAQWTSGAGYGGWGPGVAPTAWGGAGWGGGWGWGGAAPAGWGYDYGFIYACSPTWNYATGWSYPPCITPFTPTWDYSTGWSYPGLGAYPGYGPPRGGY